jgi:hypothetical protein
MLSVIALRLATPGDPLIKLSLLTLEVEAEHILFVPGQEVQSPTEP